MSELFAPSLDDQIACVEREIRQRERVYPRLVFNRKMSRASADREIEIMRTVLETLRQIKAT